MKQFTQKEFDALLLVDGVKVCPKGDYSQINVFGYVCRFGNYCSFGNGCSFGGYCRFENFDSPAKPGNPLLQFDRIGSRTGLTQFFNLERGIVVRCGCQRLTLEEFRARVQEVYGNQGHGLIYLGLCNVAEEYFRQEGERNG